MASSLESGSRCETLRFLMDNLGSRLKDIRLKAGLTLRELARKADVSASSSRRSRPEQ